jgi:hypothetical protein
MNVKEDSALHLRFDLVVALALLAAAKAGRRARPNPDVCFYLGDRYLRLAELHKERGSIRKARRLKLKAEKYLKGAGPWRDPPYAAAMAMPVPRRPTFTEAIGWRARKIPPDNAA